MNKLGQGLNKLKEYSKQILSLMVAVWFAGAAFGGVVVIIELLVLLIGGAEYSMVVTVHLPELLAYIGAPMTGGIIGYLIKSALENREKIKNDNSPVAETIIEPITNENPDEP